MGTGLRVHVLGSGTPTPTPDRFGSAFVVDVDGDKIMIDCGPAATWKLAKAGLSPTEIETLFFTHHHFDHDVDYPCMLLTRWDQGTGDEERLKVFGPAPTSELTERLIGRDGAFAHDYRARINYRGSQQVYVNRGGTLPRQPPVVDATDIEPGFEHAGSNWLMRSSYAQHVQPYLDSLAYRLDTNHGSVVFTGDTEPCESVRQLAQGADLMLCMCWGIESDVVSSGEDPGVCALEGAAQMAADAGVANLVLVHTGPTISQRGNMETALAGLGRDFAGPVVFAEELMTLELGTSAETPSQLQVRHSLQRASEPISLRSS